MGLTGQLLGLMAMETARALAGDTAITCHFPPNETDRAPTIAFQVTPAPSLRDLPNLQRVTIRMNGKVRMAGTLRQSRQSGLEALVLKGRSERNFLYAVGMHHSGTAVLTIKAPVDLPPTSRQGRCTGQEQGWTTSR